MKRVTPPVRPGGCGLHADFCGTPQDLQDFIIARDRAKERRQQ
jgi:hypothetical protein